MGDELFSAHLGGQLPKISYLVAYVGKFLLHPGRIESPQDSTSSRALLCR
jgi:hypothetical protein